MSDILDLSFEKRIYVHIKKNAKKKRERDIKCVKTTLLLFVVFCS